MHKVLTFFITYKTNYELDTTLYHVYNMNHKMKNVEGKVGWTVRSKNNAAQKF